MDEKKKLVDYSFSTSESDDEPGPKRRAVGIVKPVPQQVLQQEEQSASQSVHGSPSGHSNPEEIEIADDSNPEEIENPEENEPLQPDEIITIPSNSDSDTISIKTVTTYGEFLFKKVSFLSKQILYILYINILKLKFFFLSRIFKYINPVSYCKKFLKITFTNRFQ